MKMSVSNLYLLAGPAGGVPGGGGCPGQEADQTGGGRGGGGGLPRQGGDGHRHRQERVNRR